MRQRLFAAAAVAALFALCTGSAVAASAPKLTPTKASSFPNRSYILSFPNATHVATEGVSVFENGKPVNDLLVELPGQTPGSATVGVVLLIDASLSMQGEPIKQAMVAARAFASNRASQEQLAALFFNTGTKVALPLTNNDGEVLAALSKTPRLAFGTHINDAVQEAVKLLDSANVDIGSIVLLSDGRDVGSVSSEADAIADAARAHARVFSVGLRSTSFSPSTLNRFAQSTGGTFTIAASPASLRKIYSALSSAISNEYLITYRSLVGPSQKVVVSVKVPGVAGAAVTRYTSPGLETTFFTQHRSWWSRFLESTIAASLVIALVVLLFGFSVYLIFRRRDRRFERRLARFVSLPSDERVQLQPDDAVELEVQSEQRQIAPSDWYARFEEEIEVGRLETTPRTIIGLAVVGSVLVGVTFAIMVGSGWGLFLGLAVPVIVRWFVGFRLRRLQLEFAEQLPDNLDVVSSALRAGHSLVGALSVTVDASSEPSRTELGRALADEQLGVPLDEALRVVAKRMANRDLLQVAMVSMLQREAGTNAAEVLERVSENVRAQMDLKRLVRTLTAQGRMARWIVSLLPLFLFSALFLINRKYLEPLWQTNGGIAAMVLAGLMVVAGSLLIKRIVEIEV